MRARRTHHNIGKASLDYFDSSLGPLVVDLERVGGTEVHTIDLALGTLDIDDGAILGALLAALNLVGKLESFERSDLDLRRENRRRETEVRVEESLEGKWNGCGGRGGDVESDNELGLANVDVVGELEGEIKDFLDLCGRGELCEVRANGDSTLATA